MMEDLKNKILFLKIQNAPIEEIRLLEILQKENEWKLLPKNEKQKKRILAIKILADTYQKNIVDLYDIGEEIISKTLFSQKNYLRRLGILINIQQEFIDEETVKNLHKIKKIDIDIIRNLFMEIKTKNEQEYKHLRLEEYFKVFENIWFKRNIL